MCPERFADVSSRTMRSAAGPREESGGERRRGGGLISNAERSDLGSRTSVRGKSDIFESRRAAFVL